VGKAVEGLGQATVGVGEAVVGVGRSGGSSDIRSGEVGSGFTVLFATDRN